MKKIIITAAILLLVIIVGSGAFYTVAENEYVCVMRFSEIVKVDSEPGLHLKLPFIDDTRSFPKTTLIYDIPPSEVLTSDKKNMTVDSYIVWEISDPKIFYRTLGTTSEAEARLNAVTYNSLKNLMGKLQQSDIINMDDASERNDIYAGITKEVAGLCDTYGINVLDVKIKRFDLPDNNEQA
ncbi:MAG: SPFH domain-containing protein, partial [Candidatus Flemingiibacterium sp.]